MKIMTVGIDLANNVFAVHGIDEHGKAVVVRPSVRREQLLGLVASLVPCVIGMEACSGAHDWARTEEAYVYWVRAIIQFFGLRHPPTMRIIFSGS